MPPRRSLVAEIEPSFRLNFGPKFAFGPGKAELLERIAQTGSIAQAAQGMGMSYMRAWKIVKSLEQGLREPLVTKVRGGKTQGAVLTETGKEILRLYRGLEKETKSAVAKAKRRLARLAR